MYQSGTAEIQPRGASLGILVLAGGAFLLIQLTSLLLGPEPSRQFNLSLTVPSIELEETPVSLGDQVDAVVGALAGALPVSAGPSVTASPRRQSGARPSSKALPPAPSIPTATAVVTSSDPTVSAAHRGHDDRGRERQPKKAPEND